LSGGLYYQIGLMREPFTEDDIEAAKAMLANPDIAVTQIAQRLGVSPATLYRYLPAARTANTPGV
jgi:AcrR family transcriptional regulator